MKKIMLLSILALNITSSFALELEYVHLKTGVTIDAKNEVFDIDLNEIEAFQVSNENSEDRIISVEEYRMIDNKMKNSEEMKFSRSVGDGSGGG